MTEATETGRLEDMPPAELLRDHGKRTVTGCLRMETGDIRAAVWLRDGLVYTASAPSARARLGDRLVGAGHITEQQLAETLEQQQAMDERRRIGELLIDSGLIDRETMRAYVREQIADSVAVTLGWLEGSWAFHAGEEVHEDIPLDESVENLLMEGARRLEEWEVIQRRIGSVDAIVDFVPSGGTAELQLTADEWSMLTRIDGMSSVREIAGDAGYSEFAAARIIYGLLTAGVVTLVEEDEEDLEELTDLEDLDAFRDLADDLAADDLADDLDASGTGDEVVVDLDADLDAALDAAPDERGAPAPSVEAAAELAGLLTDVEPPVVPPAEVDAEHVEAADIDAADTDEVPPPDRAQPVDRNELLREFAALDNDWSVAAPPTPSASRSEGSGADAGRGDPPAPPARRPAPPPPEEKGKRGLFGRKRKD